jgi:drug/metabolite transporter (DMT)-like permease
MNPVVLSVLIGITLSFVTVGADYLVKKASIQSGVSGWPSLTVGAAIYALTALGWFFVMRHLKLSTLGVLYAVTCAILLTFLSVTVFHERLVWQEMLGIALAIGSLLLLARFS